MTAGGSREEANRPRQELAASPANASTHIRMGLAVRFRAGGQHAREAASASRRGYPPTFWPTDSMIASAALPRNWKAGEDSRRLVRNPRLRKGPGVQVLGEESRTPVALFCLTTQTDSPPFSHPALALQLFELAGRLPFPQEALILREPCQRGLWVATRVVCRADCGWWNDCTPIWSSGCGRDSRRRDGPAADALARGQPRRGSRGGEPASAVGRGDGEPGESLDCRYAARTRRVRSARRTYRHSDEGRQAQQDAEKKRRQDRRKARGEGDRSLIVLPNEAHLIANGEVRDIRTCLDASNPFTKAAEPPEPATLPPEYSRALALGCRPMSQQTQPVVGGRGKRAMGRCAHCGCLRWAARCAVRGRGRSSGCNGGTP